MLASLFVFGATLQPSVSWSQQEPETPEDQPLREQTIYIPYSKIRGIFEKEGRGVFIPYEQFQTLWKQARKAEQRQPDDPGPPVDALISQIESEAVVDADVVRVTALLQIELLGRGWHEVPVQLADAAILSAEIDDQPARLVPDGNGYKLLIEKPEQSDGRVQVKLTYAKAFSKSPGRNMVEFQAPQSPVNQWRIRVPQSGVKINIHPMIAATEVDADKDDADDVDGDETVVMAFVGAAPRVRIDWTPRSEGASGMAALATVHSQQQWIIEPGIARVNTRLDYAISRAELTDLTLEVPKGYKVTGVLDANVRRWDVTQEGEGREEDVQRIAIELFQPAKGNQSVLVELEQFSNQESESMLRQVPVVRAVGVGRQHGQIAVRLAETLRGEVVSRSGLLQIDLTDLPNNLKQGKWDFAFGYNALPIELTLGLQPVSPQVQASTWLETFVEPEQITLRLSALYSIRRAGIFQLAFDVPTDYEIQSVRGVAAGNAIAAQYDSHHFSDEQPGRLIVNLSAKAIGDVLLQIRMQRRLDDPNLIEPTDVASELPMAIPRVAQQSVDNVTAKWVVYAAESLRIQPTAVGLQPIAMNEAMSHIPGLQQNRVGDTRPVLAYAVGQQDVSLALSAQRRKPQVTAKQLMQVDITAGAVEYRSRFLFDILYSGVKSLRIDVPQALASQIRNQSSGLNDLPMSPQPDDVPENYVAWQFTGESQLLGRHEVTLTWEEKLTGLGVGESKDLALPWLQPADCDRAWGQIVIGKAETLDVRPKEEPTGLRPIDPQTDLIESIRVAGAARAFEFQDDWKLTITATRYELEDVKHTSIERAVVRMVVGADRQTSVQALYRMRSAQQRLEVKLPSTFDPAKGFNQNPLRINGRPVPLERGDTGEYYVPLADQSPEEPFVLDLRYAVDEDQRHLALPQFPNDPAVQKVYLCAYLPQDQAIIGTRGPWENDLENRWRRFLFGYRYQNPGDDELVQWVTDSIPMTGSPTSDFQTQGLLYTFSTAGPPSDERSALNITSISKDLLDAIIFLLIAVPGVVLVTQPLSRRLAAVGVTLFGLVFAAVFLPSLSLQIFDTVLFLAIFLVLAVWSLLGFLRLTRKATKHLDRRTPPPPSHGSPPPSSPSPVGSSPVMASTALAMAGESGSHAQGASHVKASSPQGLFGEGGLFGWSSRSGGTK
ncbi:MAG: hypothetical protein R3C05_06240 [Pirellulaceae bacterium]